MNKKSLLYFDKANARNEGVRFELVRPALEPDNGATSWYAEIGLGTPPQAHLRFMIDTGTKNTWITSTLCTTQACARHNKFNPEDSSTYEKAGSSQTISFGAWGSMDITPSTDMISLPGLANELPINFDLSTKFDGPQFEQLICDGGIGIPQQMPAGEHSTEILNALSRNGAIAAPIVSFWYDRANLKGTATMGAVNFTKFKPETINTIPMIDFPADTECWLVNLETMSGLFADGSEKNMLTNVAFALDTGSSRFKGDEKFIAAAVKVITNDGAYPQKINSTQRISDYPYPTLKLVMNGVTYLLPPEKYFIQDTPDQRVLAFLMLDDMDNEFLVGTTFLESVYSVFDFENRCITLAEPVF